MCGIAGIIGLPLKGEGEEKRSLLKHRLQQMTNSLLHRGPDGEGCWINPSVLAGFGHRRLSVIDLSDNAAQPMHYQQRYTIIHNGEIYNYIEIREDLQKKGYIFNTGSDTEVILAAYAHYNDECIEYFDGMFAFAIWDEEEQELFAARDRFGEKPFYYSFNNNEFAFASEMKALWAAGIEKRPNLQMLFNFITIGYTDNPGRPEETFFENVFKLPAASRLYYTPSSNELIIEKYWDIDPSVQEKKISDGDAVEKFNALFSASVKRRLRSDVAIGTSLSGGLDSSSVLSTVSLLSAGRSALNSFTAIFPGFEKDESAFALQIAKQFNLQHHTVSITADDLVNDWEKFLHYQEEPFGSASAFAQYKEIGRAHV